MILKPDAQLSKIEKVDGPGTDDGRSYSARFQPGTRIEQDDFGSGVVLKVEDDVLTVRAWGRTDSIFLSEDVPVVWPLKRPPIDFGLPREQRRLWCWLDGRYEPCSCCGYPNLGARDEFDVEPVQCIVCGWSDEGDGEEDADEVRPPFDPEDPYDLVRPNAGYSLTDARKNCEAEGVMFSPDDLRRKTFDTCVEERKKLCGVLDPIIAEKRNIEVGQIVRDVRLSILRVLQE